MSKKFYSLDNCANYGQSEKVYDWEDEIFDNKTDELLTLEGCQRFVDDVWADLKLEKKKKTPQVLDGRGSAMARTDGTLHIHLPKWSRNHIVVTHEIAHCITDLKDEQDSMGHGGLYMHVYLRMLEKYLGYNAKKLALSARSVGIMVSQTGMIKPRLGWIEW